MPRQNGFSLIELLIVVVIIGILAAIAVPNLLLSRRAANESMAVSAIRNLSTAQMTYQASVGAGNFAGSTTADVSGLTILKDLNVIDPALGSGTKSGYGFIGAKADKDATTPATFWFSACPTQTAEPSKTGSRVFGIQVDGVIYYQSNLTHFTSAGEISGAQVLNN